MDTTAADAPTIDATSGRRRGTDLATLGLLMLAGGPALLLVASIAFGLTESTGFFLVPAVLGVVGAWLVRRDRTWAKVVGLLLALVIFSFVWWMTFGLSVPASFFDFVPATLVLPGLVLTITGAVMALRAGRSGRTAEPGERRIAAAVLGVVGVLAVLSLVLTLTGRETVPDALADEADAVVHLQDFEFDHGGYDVPAGGSVLVKNDDPVVHNFSVDALHIDVDLGPGSEKLVEIPSDAGTYVLYCNPHTSDKEDPGKDDMASELTVD